VRAQRITKVAFITVMSVLLVLPGVQMVVPFVHVPILQEYRRLAPFPDLSKIINEKSARLAPSINKWFDDNMGFRPILTRVNNQIDYSLFGYSRIALIGRNGWFYEPIWISDLVAQERQGEQLQREVQQRVVAIAEYLARRNIRLVVVSVPLSSTLYPGFLPSGAPKIPQPSQFEKFTSFLKTRNDLLYVDGMDVLSPYKDMQLFFKTDHHYNPCGAYLIARALVRTIGAAESRANDPWEHDADFDLREDWSGGAFA
jgi:hypothetical protein